MNMLKLVARLTLGVNDFYNFAGSSPAIHKFIFLLYARSRLYHYINFCIKPKAGGAVITAPLAKW